MPKVRLKSCPVKVPVVLGPCLGVVFSLSLGVSVAHAKDLVVTANRVATEDEALGASVTVITAADIEHKQARTVADVLRDVPGLAVSNTGGAGRDTAIRIRGAEAYHTKLIIDGVSVSDPSRAQPSYDFGHLLASDIERIEVVRGPQSLLYGGDAIGGVITITTKRGQGKPQVSAFAEVGSNQTYTGAAGVKGATEAVSYALTATHSETGGISAASKRNGNSENDPYWNQTLSGRIGAQLTETWDVEASGRMVRAKVDYDSWSGGQAVDDTDRMHQTERSGRLGTSFSVFDGRLTNALSYTIAETERDIGKGKVQTSSFDGESQTWAYQGTARLAADHTLVFGAETKTDATDQSGILRDVANNGYYTDYQFSPLEALYLTIGGRLDDHQAYGTHDTWRGTAAYLIERTETRLHGSYGTGFRAPSLYELYHPTWGTVGLNPEQSRGWDAGVEQTFLHGRAMVDVTWFDNRISDLIQWSMAGYTNIASTRSQGLEASGHWDVSDAWRVEGSYTFTDSRNNSTGQMLARRPKHQGQVTLGWLPRHDLSIDSTVRAVGRSYDSATGAYLGGYATFDVAVAYDVTDDVRLFGRVENLADKQYEVVDTYGTPGRTAFMGVQARF